MKLILEERIAKRTLELVNRALGSILDNAVRYSPESSEVSCSISIVERNLFFEVVDKGKGFTKEALENLFKLFRLGEPHYDQNVGLSLLAANQELMPLNDAKNQLMITVQGNASATIIEALWERLRQTKKPLRAHHQRKFVEDKFSLSKKLKG